MWGGREVASSAVKLNMIHPSTLGWSVNGPKMDQSTGRWKEIYLHRNTHFQTHAYFIASFNSI